MIRNITVVVPMKHGILHFPKESAVSVGIDTVTDTSKRMVFMISSFVRTLETIVVCNSLAVLMEFSDDIVATFGIMALESSRIQELPFCWICAIRHEVIF